MTPPFRADHVGSLVRPAALVDLLASHDSTAATRDAVAAAVRAQIARCIYPVTTGGLERPVLYGGFFETLHGLSTVPADLPITRALRTNLPAVAGVTTRPAVVATGKIHRREGSSSSNSGWALLRGLMPGVVGAAHCKVTLPSPTYQHMQLAPGGAYAPGSGYTSDAEYFADLAAAYRAELRSLYDAGCRNVQVDDPGMAAFFAAEHGFRLGCCRRGADDDGVDPDDLLDEYVRVHNECLRGRPARLHVGVHLCRSAAGRGAALYDEIAAKKVLGGLDYDTFYLEYDDEDDDDGSGSGFEPLRFLPRGKSVVLGLVSTERAALEDVDGVVARVRAAAAVIARGQGRADDEVLQDTLAVGPQCGFAGVAGMTEERQWEKLELVRDVARRLWKDAA